MIDFSRAFEAVSAALGGSSPTEASPADKLSTVLSSVGLDPGMVEGLTRSQIVQLLAERGVDPGALAGQQLSQFAAQLGNTHPLAEMATQLLSRQPPSAS